MNYEGSITLSPELMHAADIYPNESVHVWNVTSGSRFETYAILGRPGSSSVCVNGAAAHCVTPGDIIIIASFVQLPNDMAADWLPTVIFVDESNFIREKRQEEAVLF